MCEFQKNKLFRIGKYGTNDSLTLVLISNSVLVERVSNWIGICNSPSETNKIIFQNVEILFEIENGVRSLEWKLNNNNSVIPEFYCPPWIGVKTINIDGLVVKLTLIERYIFYFLLFIIFF